MLDFANGFDIAVMEVDGFSHPLSAVYRRAVLSDVEELLAANRLRPVFLFEAVSARRIRPDQITADPDSRTLRNLNTREEYEKALVDAGVEKTNRSRDE
jgi:molybdopterin-guanine dinucleotide biosynthesis protein A